MTLEDWRLILRMSRQTVAAAAYVASEATERMNGFVDAAGPAIIKSDLGREAEEVRSTPTRAQPLRSFTKVG